MWLWIALLSTCFIGVSTILSKLGISDADAYAVNAVTNTVLLLAFTGAAFFSGHFDQIYEINMRTWISVGVSGAILAVSWVFYYMGLKEGSVSIVMAVQSLTIVLSMVLCAVFLKEKITLFMMAGTAMIIGGILIMMNKDELMALKGKGLREGRNRWIWFELLSAAAASVSYVIVKSDHAAIDTNVTSGLRYVIVVTALWILLFIRRRQEKFSEIDKKSWIFILLGAAASAAGHVLVYRALFFGKAAIVITLYRMGMVISIILSRVILKEKLGIRGWIGFAILTGGVALFLL